MGLAPMAVLPGRQRQGIGSQLVKRGLEILVKHSSAYKERGKEYQFTITREHLDQLEALAGKVTNVFVALVCVRSPHLLSSPGSPEQSDHAATGCDEARRAAMRGPRYSSPGQEFPPMRGSLSCKTHKLISWCGFFPISGH